MMLPLASRKLSSTAQPRSASGGLALPRFTTLSRAVWPAATPTSYAFGAERVRSVTSRRNEVSVVKRLQEPTAARDRIVGVANEAKAMARRIAAQLGHHVGWPAGALAGADA